MMNKVFLIILLCSLVLSGRSQNALRDSLSHAVEELSFHPDSVDLRLKKAAWNLQLEQWEYARSEYDYVLKRDKNNLAALFYRAYANTKLGRYSFARQDYNDFLALAPGNFEAMLGLALLNQKDKHYTEAYDLLNIICERYPDRSEAFAARGEVEKERKMYELAEYDFSRAIQIEPDNTDYILSRADVRIKLGRKAEAREDLERLVCLGISKPSLSDYFKSTK